MKVMRKLRSALEYRFNKADPKPTAVHLNFDHPPSLAEQVARLVRSERFKEAMENSDLETFEEANDFVVGEDYEPDSPHEETYDGQFDYEAAMESEREKRIRESKERKERSKEVKKAVKNEVAKQTKATKKPSQEDSVVEDDE